MVFCIISNFQDQFTYSELMPQTHIFIYSIASNISFIDTGVSLI